MTREIDALVARASKGDGAAFEELVRTTHAEAYTLALRLTNNPEDAADVVQDAYIRVHRALPKFRGDAQFSTWMYRIVANCASTQTSKRKRHRHDDLQDDQVPSAPIAVDFDLNTEKPLTRIDLTKALSSLPKALRSVVVLRDVYELSHDEIAKELDITEATAKVRLHRARKKLRDQLLPRMTEA